METKKQESHDQKGKEIYILKIYRRSSDPEKSLVGIIEDIKGEKRGVFNTEMSLLNWLLKQKGI